MSIESDIQHIRNDITEVLDNFELLFETLKQAGCITDEHIGKANDEIHEYQRRLKASRENDRRLDSLGIERRNVWP